MRRDLPFVTINALRGVEGIEWPRIFEHGLLRRRDAKHQGVLVAAGQHGRDWKRHQRSLAEAGATSARRTRRRKRF